MAKCIIFLVCGRYILRLPVRYTQTQDNCAVIKASSLCPEGGFYEIGSRSISICLIFSKHQKDIGFMKILKIKRGSTGDTKAARRARFLVTLWNDHGLRYSTAQTLPLLIRAPRIDQSCVNAKTDINQKPKIVQNSLQFE